MKPSLESDHLLVDHMLDCIARIGEYTGNERERFFGTRLVQDAVLRNLQTLAESSQRLSETARAYGPGTDWRALAGFRNILVHDYLGGIDLETVWEAVAHDLPVLAAALKGIAGVLEAREQGEDHD